MCCGNCTESSLINLPIGPQGPPGSVADCVCDYKFITSNYNSGEFYVNTTTSFNWTSLPSAYLTSTFTAAQTGKYKITVDVGCENESVPSICLLGISINNATPVNNPFSQYSISPSYNSKTIHFIVDLTATNIVTLKTKFTTGSIGIDGIKMIVEKIA